MIDNKENLSKILLILAGVLGSFYILSPFLPVILLAGVIAFALDPLIKKVRSAKWFGHASCSYFLVFGLFLLITIPFITIISKVYSIILSFDLMGEGKKQALESFGRHRTELVGFLNQVASQLGMKRTFNVEALFSDTAQQIFGRILEGGTYIITQIPDVLFSFAVFLVALFLFIRNSSWIGRSFYTSSLLDKNDSREVVRVFKLTCYASVFSSLLTGLIQSIIVSAGTGFFLDVDITLVFIITFFCSFIPVIGAAPIAFLIAIIAWIKGDTGAGIGLMVIGVIAGTVDNVIRIVLLKVAKDELHPFVDLLSVIGGVIVLGLPGLFLGPVIISTAAQLVPTLLGKEKERPLVQPPT